MIESSKQPNYEPPQSAEELLRRYAEGARYFAESELDNSVHDFRNVELEDADFSRSFIFADFRGADLKRASFASANVKTCDFRNADLEGADFSGAAIDGTLFEGANLQGARFDGAGCYGYTMKAEERPWW
jgi:uncharacterized protein YjbI with pentapeptide repeats